MISKLVEEFTWLQNTGGAILRRVHHILKVPSTVAWLGLTIGVTRELLTNLTESDSEEYQKRVDDYLRQ